MARDLLLHLLLLVLLGICFTSVLLSSADVNIDCGSTTNATDECNTNWWGDTDYISNGASQVVQINNSISVMNTLRVFTSRKKNCYTIPVDHQEGKVLVRASFYYGNYDGKSSPPSFDLLFEGNYWTTVQTTNDLVYKEVIYVTKGNTTRICVALINPGQFPFINALEIRTLNSTMYSQVDADRALIFNQRFAYGTTTNISYDGTERYGRIWNPNYDMTGKARPVAYDRIGYPTINIFNATDELPEILLENAVTILSNAPIDSPLLIVFPASATANQVYMNLYFSEMIQLGSTDRRSFRLYKDNDTDSLTGSIVPPYGNCSEIIVPDVSAYSNTVFYLKADSDSTLPPLINALEVFFISDPLTSGTNTQDVAALALLQNTFPVLQNWSGDPCLPAPYSWDWVNCNNDTPPRITALYLSSYGLSGLLPDISLMSSIEIIDLHNNSLNGSIPVFLGSLLFLQHLNLADNNFSGIIPASLCKLGEYLVVTGNPYLRKFGGSCKKRSSKLPVILGTSIPIAITIKVTVVITIVRNQRSRQAITRVIAKVKYSFRCDWKPEDDSAASPTQTQP